MKSFNVHAILLTVLWLALLSCGSTEPGDDVAPRVPQKPQEPPVEEKKGLNYLFKDNMQGYEVFRIPAIVQSKAGTVLAFAEARKKRSNGDSGDIDMVVRRSDDGGETWSEMIMIWDDGGNTCGNPSPIVDQETGRIHLLMTWNHGQDKWGDIVNARGQDTRRPYYTYSDDDGKTWSDPLEITSSVKNPGWDWYATGPVHGIQVQEGAHKGRLVVPSYFTVRADGSYKDYSHTIYSDDKGHTWKAGAPTSTGNVGECTVAELPGGRLMLNMRNSTSFARKYAISQDGGETWGEIIEDPSLTDPKCQGSLLSMQSEQGSVLLFANAASVERVNMTIKMSLDEGKAWTKKYLVHQGPSAYSDMVRLSDNKIAIFYEGGNGRPYEGIAFEVVSFDDFK